MFAQKLTLLPLSKIMLYNMTITDRINAFTHLGCFLQQFTTNGQASPTCGINSQLNSSFYASFQQAIRKAEIANPWFTETLVKQAIEGVCKMLQRNVLQQWLAKYPAIPNMVTGKKVAAVLAGNIPLVGFHDMLSVLVSGHAFLGKLSSKDKALMLEVKRVLCQIDASFNELLFFTEDRLAEFDAVIATGSNNSSRYFDYYFGKYPNIIRKNRSSVAILTGNETAENFKALANDIFMYFGLGCRNVSKLYVPEGFDLPQMIDNFEHYNHLRNHNKYANNYEYNRAIFLMNKVPHLDNGFLLVKEDKSFNSPIGVLHYQYYSDTQKLKAELSFNAHNLQCVVGAGGFTNTEIPLGQAQYPEVWDYADGVDTIEFLVQSF